MIQAESLSKTYRVHEKAPGLRASLSSLFRRRWVERPAVRDVTFSVGEGEIAGLVGANGAGKTTLVKMLAGIIHPTAGDARVLGYRPWGRDDRMRARISLVMGQKAQLWWDLPAGDCFLLLKEIYRIPDDRYRASLDYLTEVLDVRRELNVQIRRLSLGERMKMELVAALLHEPRVVFLDEPTIGLDLTAQRSIREFILRYREDHRPAMILTSHYMEDIERMCERILILREGRLVYDGSLKEVVRSYAQHKVVTAHLRKSEQPIPQREALGGIGEIEHLTEVELRVRVPRDRVADAAAEILRRFPVADLTIEEPDVGTIIERIQRERER